MGSALRPNTGVDAGLVDEPVLAAARPPDLAWLERRERELTGAMARITLVSDDGRMTHSERVIPDDLRAEHFRECLIERLRWAIGDAEAPGDEVARARRRYREPVIRAGLAGTRRAAARQRGRRSAGRAGALASSL
jgi:hypothetical protein